MLCFIAIQYILEAAHTLVGNAVVQVEYGYFYFGFVTHFFEM